ncbi:MAG: hypothetical protein QS99_C0016G0051 [archaeon GW2011_AR4]|nr:MAG: hypothetical protein QS99_C0016G0051 [archaeon GW2011_AR4]
MTVQLMSFHGYWGWSMKPIDWYIPPVQEVAENIRDKIREKKKEDKRENIIHKNPFIVAVTGQGAGGKSCFCILLKRCLPHATLLNLDGYYYPDEERHPKQMTGAHPDSFDKEGIREALHLLGSGKRVLVPQENGKRITVTPSSLIIVDGLCALLFPEWKKVYDYTIFIDCPAAIIRKRKLCTHPTKEELALCDLRIKQFEEFVAPQQQDCDIIISLNLPLTDQ